jgi:hypothetical protein
VKPNNYSFQKDRRNTSAMAKRTLLADAITGTMRAASVARSKILIDPLEDFLFLNGH